MKKFTKKVGIFVMIICLSFCFGGCTIFPSSTDWPDGQKPEYQRPAGDDTITKPGEPSTTPTDPEPTYWDEEYYDGYSDVYSGLITAYVPNVRDEGNKTTQLEQARVKFNGKVASQYAVLSEYVLYSLLGKYGGGAVTQEVTYNVDKVGVGITTTTVNSEPTVNDKALFTTMGAIERSIDGIQLNPSNPSTLEECESAEIVAKLNDTNKWLCNMGIGTGNIDSDYNANYVAKYKTYLQIRLMEEITNSATKTTLSIYNGYSDTNKNNKIVELSKKIPSIGLNTDSVLASKIEQIIKNEIIGSEAITRSTASIEVKERFEYTYPNEIKYTIGEVVYEGENYTTTQATTKLGGVYLEQGNPIEIVVTNGEKLYYPSGNPVIVDIDIDGTILKTHASVGQDYTLTQIPAQEVVNYIKELDANNNGVIDINGYTNATLYGYTYANDVNSIVSDMLDFANTMPKVDSREYLSIDSTEYYSAITKPETGKLADITHMDYQNYTSAIVYNKQYAFPWILGVNIQSKENLVIDVYIRVRKTYVDGFEQKTVTQVLKLGTMHTDSTKDFYWAGDVDDEDESVDYNTVVANSQMWDMYQVFGNLLPEVTMADMKADSEAYIDEDGILQFTINDIDFGKPKFKDYRYLYYMQVQGITPPAKDGKVVTEVVTGTDEVSQQQGYYQGDYNKYVATNKVTGTASDQKEITFSQNLIVFNEQSSQEDYIEIIFDVTNKDSVTDSSFKFLIEESPSMEEEE